MHAIPEGFVVAAAEGSATLIADARYAEAFLESGLDRIEGWQTYLASRTRGAGRGATARLEFADGTRARLKQLRRGGLLGPLWRDRFFGRGRALANLSLPLEALRRGVATPAPLALLLVGTRAGLVRAWLALEELVGAVDLAALTASPDPPRTPELLSVMTTVRRMHDQGFEHRDLNLGNLMIAREPVLRTHVIDMDRTRIHDGPLAFGPRLRALRRMERSHLKSGFPAEQADEYYRLYAGEDRLLARRLARGRERGRFSLFLHRSGWRR